MKNNKTLRLAEAECGAAATFPAHQGRAPSRQKKAPSGLPPGASCATLVNALFWKILVTRVKSFFMASKPAFVSRAQRSASHKRVHARLRRAMASGALQTPISGLPEIDA